MKKNIHPDYKLLTASCSCGNVIEVNSTLGCNINLDVCSNCHPAYTNKKREAATGGRVDRFKKRFSFLESSKAE
ncbi:50S ribosomal protein L31 [Candidatus Williamhamiltonella defendens]|uniref:50S ribosomal protein L31 n=1 Tax=Candidatus Williamhamiltonella defendens TaxID=138072 RepID=UPI0002F3D763|nr:50S ribosomal protein L31 [Candidatus Hamiltonella defensa]CED78553.1 50S ribosomal protein L31 [Candidatus Hamiltonella defensa (Bemisia tabaci)]